MGIIIATTGGIAAAAAINQYGDVPGTIASASASAAQTLSGGTYATLPVTPVATSLVLTHANTLVAVCVSGQFGNASALGTPTGIALMSFALSGATSVAASDVGALEGNSPGFTSGGGILEFFVVPAGTLTATVQARVSATGSGMQVRGVLLQIVAIRPL